MRISRSFSGFDTRLARQGKRFAKSLKHGRDQEIAGELDRIRPIRNLPCNKRLLADGFENRLATIQSGRRSCGDDEEFRRGSSFRTAKNGSSDILLASVSGDPW